MTLDETLAEYSARINVSVEELKAMIEPIMKAYKKTFPKAKPKKIESEALSELRMRLQGEYGKLTSPAITNTGEIVGDTGRYDWIEMMYRAALKRYNDNPDDAKSQGYVDDHGTPIARRDRKFGKGVKKGEILEGEELQRDIYAFAKWEGQKQKRLVKVQFKDDIVDMIKIDPAKDAGYECNWRSNVGELSTVTTQNASKAAKTTFVSTGKEEPLSYDEIKQGFKDTIGLLQILDIEREWRRTPSDDRAKMVVAFECRVVRVSAPDPESDMDNYIVTVTDTGLDLDLDERGQTIYLPDFWYTGWDKNAKIIVLGRPRMRKFMDEDQMVIDAFGVHVDPFSLVRITDEAPEEEFEEVGFVRPAPSEGSA
jgi:hypothetical protein